MQGNRTPYTDPLSRGALVGLTLKHGPSHLFKALMESVCYGTALILGTFKAAGYAPESLTLAGARPVKPLPARRNIPIKPHSTNLCTTPCQVGPPRATCGCRCMLMSPTCRCTCQSE